MRRSARQDMTGLSDRKREEAGGGTRAGRSRQEQIGTGRNRRRQDVVGGDRRRGESIFTANWPHCRRRGISA